MPDSLELETLKRELADCQRVYDALSPGHDKQRYRDIIIDLQKSIEAQEAFERRQERMRAST
jgi:hypothetical protein